VYDTIHIHAGLPKTGTTSLQLGMQALSRAGRLTRTAYPVVAPELGPGNGVRLADELLFTNPAPASRPRLQALVDDLLQADASGAPNLLISSEDLCYASVEKFTLLKQVLSAHAREVRMLVAVRPLREWSYSVYLQLVKAHALAADYDVRWLQAHRPEFLWYFRNLDRFQVATTCFAYRRSGLLLAFLQLIGEDPALAAAVPEAISNRSLSIAELELLRLVNSVFHDQALCRSLSEALSGSGVARPPARFPAAGEPGFQVFSADFAADLQQLPGPVMAAASTILFEEPAATAVDLPEPPSAPRSLATDDVALALQAIRSHCDQRAGNAAGLERLRAYAANLQPTASRVDPIHYLLLHPDLLGSGVDPGWHYREHGQREGRDSAFEVVPPG
jgi:hypothetical protein